MDSDVLVIIEFGLEAYNHKYKSQAAKKLLVCMRKKMIRVSSTILMFNGDEYYYADSPGIAAGLFGELRSTDTLTELKDFHKYSKLSFEMMAEENTPFEFLKEELVRRLEYSEEIVMERGFPLYIQTDSMLVFIGNMSYCIEKFMKRFHIKDQILTVYLIYSNQAGEIWSDDGLRYYMNSKEAGRHNRAHVHVRFKHEEEGAIAIDNGEVLAGDLSPRIIKKAKKKILANQQFLFECWNDMTDGLYVDINNFFGVRPVKI